MSIAANLSAIHERIARAAKRAGRNVDDVALMAVTKTHPAEQIVAAYDAGQRLFGENRVQEFADKSGALAKLLDAEFHMIGHLQSNKTGKAADIFHAIDSVDSSKLAARLNTSAEELGKTIDVLIEINVGGEEAKSGIAPDSPELEQILDRCTRVATSAGSRADDRASVHRRSRRSATLLPATARVARSSGGARSAGGQAGCAVHGHVARLRGRHRRRLDLRADRHGHLWNARQAMIPVRDTPSGATFQVKVHPRAKKNAITGEAGDALKLALTAPPVEGRANEACIAFLAELLNVSRSSVTIAAGESSRNKVIRVRGMSAAEVRSKRLERNSSPLSVT